MKLTAKQQEDLESIKYFLFSGTESVPITEKDIKMFFEYSERGLHKDKVRDRNPDGFNALCQGKRWRGIHMHEMFEPGIVDGTMPYWVILGGYKGDEPMPRCVVDFMKKEMFKGKDADLIERCYQEILYDKLPWYKKLFLRLKKVIN